MNKYLDISKEVKEAIYAGKPVLSTSERKALKSLRHQEETLQCFALKVKTGPAQLLLP